MGLGESIFFGFVYGTGTMFLLFIMFGVHFYDYDHETDDEDKEMVYNETRGGWLIFAAAVIFVIIFSTFVWAGVASR